MTKESYTYNTSEGVVIQRFSNEVCGVRVKKIAQPLDGEWKLIAQDDRLNNDTDSFKLSVSSEFYNYFLHGAFI